VNYNSIIEMMHDTNIKTIIENAISSNTLKDTTHFIIINLNIVTYQFHHWIEKMPRVKPYYAIKSNTNPIIIKLLHKLGCHFDVASKNEIETILNCDIEAENMIYANPCKSIEYIKYAKEKGVNLLVIDSICEMEKIKCVYPEANILIRIKVDDSYSLCKFNSKYGLDYEEIDNIFEKAKEMKLNIVGVSFHVGSGCKNENVFDGAIRNCKTIIDNGKKHGFEMNILDIGGGFLGEIDNIIFDKTADVINYAIEECFFNIDTSSNYRNLKFIAEPGRYFSSASHTLVTSIISIKIKINPENGIKTMIYYITDGIYGIFSGIMFDYAHFELEWLPNEEVSSSSTKLYNTIIFGPTCDSLDIISNGCMMPLMNLGDKIIIRNIGAYSIVSSTEFNGFPIPEKYYIH